MADSTSRNPSGYVLDTNVLSLFAKIGRLNLLQQIATVPLFVTPAIQDELKTGVANGVSYLADALKLIDSEVIELLTISPVDLQYMENLPAKLASGEAEAIASCYRDSLTLISHDRKAINYCEREKIDYIPLIDLAEVLHQAGQLTDDEIDEMFA